MLRIGDGLDIIVVGVRGSRGLNGCGGGRANDDGGSRVDREVVVPDFRVCVLVETRGRVREGLDVMRDGDWGEGCFRIGEGSLTSSVVLVRVGRLVGGC